jgi:MobA/MobL family protein
VAIFSLNHSFVGRTTHPPGSASLFARYITRPGACTETLGQRMPTERGPLMAWLDEQEQGDRKNARVIDKIVVALPIELSHEQNLVLLQNFGERMTEGRAAWMAAVHDGPGDADNPHAHIIFRDRDLETGRRVMLTTEQGSTERFRDAWEQEANIALERGGFDERIDKRSLKDQGIDREPQIHVGAGAEKLREQQYEFRSAEKEITRLIDGVPTTVTVNYPVIDEGKTRFQENEERIQRNIERARTLAEIAVEHEKLEIYYSAATAALKSVPGKRAWTEADRFQHIHDAIRGFNASQQDDSDPLTSVIGEHLAARTKKQIEQDTDFRFGELPLRSGGSEQGERAPRRDAGDLLVGGGLAIFGRLSQALESFFDDAPATRDSEAREQDMPRKQPAGQPTIEQRTEQQQRGQEAEQAAYRKQELEAYLDQRDKERHHDRGR